MKAKKTAQVAPRRPKKSVKKARKPASRRTRANREASGKAGYKVGRGKPPVETRFQPGQSGNPNGRPKGSNLTRLIKDALESPSPVKGEPRSEGEVIVSVLIRKARTGNLKATEILLDRMEGKARQPIELGGMDGQPITVSIADTIERLYAGNGASSSEPVEENTAIN